MGSFLSVPAPEALSPAPQQHADGQPGPVQHGAGLQHGHVQQPVVWPGVRHDRQPALEPAEVADQHPLADPGDRAGVVQSQLEAGGPAAKLP